MAEERNPILSQDTSPLWYTIPKIVDGKKMIAFEWNGKEELLPLEFARAFSASLLDAARDAEALRPAGLDNSKDGAVRYSDYTTSGLEPEKQQLDPESIACIGSYSPTDNICTVEIVWKRVSKMVGIGVARTMGYMLRNAAEAEDLLSKRR